MYVRNQEYISHRKVLCLLLVLPFVNSIYNLIICDERILFETVQDLVINMLYIILNVSFII